MPIPMAARSKACVCGHSLVGPTKNGVSDECDSETILNFRQRAVCILGQAFHYSPENAIYIFSQ